MNYLLDTCTFLWVISDDPRLSDAARRTFEDSANGVFLSCVSTWEIAVKYTLGKLPLPAAPQGYIPLQRERHGVESLALDEAATLHLLKLPELHKDPFDRMLVCQALVAGLAIITPDELIAQYPVRTVW